MADVVVVVPALGRPQRVCPLVDSFEATTPSVLARLLFVCTPGDADEIAACEATGAEVLTTDWVAGYADFARKIQLAFDRSREPFLFQAADDVEFTAGWAEAALEQIESDGYGVCGTDDQANPVVMRGLHSTHSLIRRAYVDECGASWDGPGSVFSTAYSHQRCDNELVELAKRRGCFTFAPRSVVRHHHPLFDRSVQMDDTYRRALADGLADSRLFESRQAEWLRELAA